MTRRYDIKVLLRDARTRARLLDGATALIIEVMRWG
jgi:hypothetical protein